MLARSSVTLWMVLVLVGLVPGCKKGLGEPCEEDGECRGECTVTLVVSGSKAKTCAEPCDSDEDCGEGAVCHLGNYCAPTCDGDKPCPEDAVCEPYFQLCAAPCMANTDCEWGSCVEGLCE